MRSFEQEGVTFNSLLFKMNLNLNNTLNFCLRPAAKITVPSESEFYIQVPLWNLLLTLENLQLVVFLYQDKSNEKPCATWEGAQQFCWWIKLKSIWHFKNNNKRLPESIHKFTISIFRLHNRKGFFPLDVNLNTQKNGRNLNMNPSHIQVSSQGLSCTVKSRSIARGRGGRIKC